MGLEHYQKDFAQNNFQFLLVGKDGNVLESEPLLLPINKGDSIAHFHPFFECLSDLEQLPENEFLFYCVHLPFDEKEYITDIRILRKKEGLLVIVQNLTEHYNHHQAVAQSRNESVINEELIFLKNAELEERERFKNQFIRNFSHELRNPLMTGMAIAQILGNTQLTIEQKQLLEALLHSHEHLKLLLEDTLSLSLIASGKLEVKSLPFDLGELLKLLAFTYQAKGKTLGIHFEFTLDDNVPLMVEGDRLRLFQVLTNLLDNALKYTKTGTISLQVGLNQLWAGTAHVRFAVCDTGPGIPQNRQDLVFEAFAHPHHDGQGNGLGLALVKGLLILMGSEILLESEPGKGSVFSFSLGLKIQLRSRTAPAPSPQAVLDYEKMGVPGKKYRLLLVEDDERLLTVLFKMLMDSRRFYIDILNDGGQVLESVVQNEYDIVLMDINLPNMQGDQLTKVIRKFPFKNIRDLPIVGMTANAYQEDIKYYKKTGVNAVLAKPFDQNILITTLFSALKAI